MGSARRIGVRCTGSDLDAVLLLFGEQSGAVAQRCQYIQLAAVLDSLGGGGGGNFDRLCDDYC